MVAKTQEPNEGKEFFFKTNENGSNIFIIQHTNLLAIAKLMGMEGNRRLGEDV